MIILHDGNNDYIPCMNGLPLEMRSQEYPDTGINPKLVRQRTRRTRLSSASLVGSS